MLLLLALLLFYKFNVLEVLWLSNFNIFFDIVYLVFELLLLRLIMLYEWILFDGNTIEFTGIDYDEADEYFNCFDLSFI